MPGRFVGAIAALLMLLVDLPHRDVIAGSVLHGDDTPVPILAPGTGKTRTGRLWTYVRDTAAIRRRPCSSLRPIARMPVPTGHPPISYDVIALQTAAACDKTHD